MSIIQSAMREIATYHEMLRLKDKPIDKNLPIWEQQKILLDKQKALDWLLAFGNAELDPTLWILYDRQRIPTTSQVTLTFFQNAIGTTQDGRVKNRWDTNMRQSGQLPAPQVFSVHGVSIQYQPTSSPIDMEAIVYNTFTVLRVGEKDYLEAPCEFIPSGGGLYGYLGGDTNVQLGAVTVNVPSVHEVYPVIRGLKPLTISAKESFSSEIQWGNTITLAATVDVRYKLHGVLYRAKQ